MTLDQEKVRAIGKILNNPERPLKERFRALFTLRNIGGEVAVKCIADSFSDESALLKHELAYCLGQMQDKAALPILNDILRNRAQDVMVRHEAGEALGAIGMKDSLEILEEYCLDPEVPVSETCKLATERIKWLNTEEAKNEMASCSVYKSIDPAPPSLLKDVSKLRNILLNEELRLFDRYRAMFALRDIGTDESVLALSEGLNCSGALFCHEVAYVLGQIQSPVCVNQLTAALENKNQDGMVRHECAEALGSIATPKCMETLRKYLHDDTRVVRESCEVALDMCDYENSAEFQYANSLIEISVAEV